MELTIHFDKDEKVKIVLILSDGSHEELIYPSKTVETRETGARGTLLEDMQFPRTIVDGKNAFSYCSLQCARFDDWRDGVFLISSSLTKSEKKIDCAGCLKEITKQS